MKKIAFVSLAVLIGLAFASGFTHAAEAPFYEGKTIRIIVGFTAGGGFDAYARAIARHMGKHIPGSPTVIVDNMPGAGSVITANHIYKVAKPDGLSIGHFYGNLVWAQMFKKPGIEFDFTKYEWVGAPVKEETVVALTKASGITSMEKWFASKTPVKLGGMAIGAGVSDNVPRLLRAAIGIPLRVISGYKGTADIRLAAESGELAGAVWQHDAVRATWTKALESGDVAIVLQCVAKPFPDLPNVPLAMTYAKTDEARKLIEVGIYGPTAFSRPFATTPGTPKDRVQILRNAFQATLRDKEFLAEAEKSKLGIQPVTGEEIETLIQNTLNLNPAMQAKLEEILFSRE